MSEQTDRIRSRVTSEWRTTEDIAGDRYPSPMYTVASRILNRMARDGEVEKGWADGTGYRTRTWRLRP